MTGAPYQPQKVTILIIDDHELIRKSIIKVLQKMRFQNFVECSNADEAIRQLEGNPFDLIFLDLFLQSSNGFAVLNYVRNRDTSSDIPVIVVTGEASKDDIVKAADMGAGDYLLKPFQTVDLEKKVTQVLTKYFSPTPLVAFLRQAENHIAQNNLKEASAIIDKALEIEANSSRALHLKALVSEKAGDIEEAAKILKQSIRENPSYIKNYRSLGNLYIRHNNLSEGIAAIRRELELSPKQPDRQVYLAKLMQKTGNLHSAAEHYRLALLEDQKLKAALFGMGKIQADTGNIEKAVYYFKRIRRYHPDNTKSLEAIVQVAMAADQPKIAEVALKDEKKANPKKLDTYEVLCKFFASTERLDEAVQTSNELLAIAPDHLDGMKIKALLLFKQGDLNTAIELLKKVLAQKPDLEAAVKLAEIYIEKKNIMEAMQLLHNALKSKQHTGHILALILSALSTAQQNSKAYFLALRLRAMGIDNPQVNELLKKSKDGLVARRNQVLNIAS